MQAVNAGMAARFVTIDYDTPLLLPPNLREWVPAGHLAHFILDAVEEMDLRQVRVNERGTGSEQYPPQMLLALFDPLYQGTSGSMKAYLQEVAKRGNMEFLVKSEDSPDYR